MLYVLANQEHTVYQNPDAYESGSYSYWNRRDNLARGVAV
jgi:hypothetical protein